MVKGTNEDFLKKVQDSLLSLAQIMCNSYWNSLRIPGALAKGQLISKAIYGLLTSPKYKGQICFVCFFTLHGKQIKFVRSFFGRIYGAPNLLSVLSEL